MFDANDKDMRKKSWGKVIQKSFENNEFIKCWIVIPNIGWTVNRVKILSWW